MTHVTASPQDEFDQTGRYDATRLREVFEHDMTYLAGVERNTHRYANRPAISDPGSGRSWTYAELGQATDRLAGGLYRLGLTAQRLALVELFNGPEFALLYPTTQKLRAVFSPTNFRLAAGEVAHMIDDARPAVFVFDQARTGVIAEALALAQHQPLALVEVAPVSEGSAADASEDALRLRSFAQAHGLPLVDFEELLTAEPLSDEERNANNEGQPPVSVFDETTRLYTSGTTGMPKAVPLPSLVEIYSAHDVIMHFPLSPQDKTLNMSPLFHRGGLYAGGPNPVFYVGAENVTLRNFDENVVLDLVQERGLTYLIGAPANLYRLAAAQEANPRDLSSLRGIVTMGAPLERAAALRFQKVLSPRIFNGYGTSETFWNTFLRPENLPDGAGTAGQASTDDDVAVVRVYEDHLAKPEETVPKDGKTVGEFAARSLKSGYSYLGNEEAEHRKLSHGWFYPGDLATWDENEMITIVGRKDDMIISGGENVHPVQVEEVLSEHDGVADAMVVGVPDSEWGQKVAAYVVRADAGVEDGGLPADDVEAAKALDEYAGSHPRLARYKRPRLYRFVNAGDLPYNATGKKVHYVATEMAERDLEAGLWI